MATPAQSPPLVVWRRGATGHRIVWDPSGLESRHPLNRLPAS
jgi:hypothetical protein